MSTQPDASMPSVDAAPPVDAAVDSTPPDGGIADYDGGAVDAGAILAARPYTLHVPTSYQASQPAPLVIMFHGYGASGFLEETYIDFTPTSDSAGFLYAYGDGTLDTTNSRFWNATNGCCDLYDIPVDDVQYFDAILADVQSKYNVDPKRIFVFGHSNGGFMSHRLACDRASKVAAIVSLEGAQWDDLGNCNPSAPVSVVEIHGTADTTIPYDGGATMEGPYPTAPTTVADWAQKNGCTGSIAANGQTLDLVSTLPGNETTVEAYAGCPTGNDVQLWVVDGGVHIPTLSAGFGGDVWGFLSAHPKP